MYVCVFILSTKQHFRSTCTRPSAVQFHVGSFTLRVWVQNTDTVNFKIRLKREFNSIYGRCFQLLSIVVFRCCAIVVKLLNCIHSVNHCFLVYSYFSCMATVDVLFLCGCWYLFWGLFLSDCFCISDLYNLLCVIHSARMCVHLIVPIAGKAYVVEEDRITFLISLLLDAYRWRSG